MSRKRTKETIARMRKARLAYWEKHPERRRKPPLWRYGPNAIHRSLKVQSNGNKGITSEELKRAWSEAKLAARPKALLPIGTVVKLSALGLSVSGPREKGYGPDTRAVVVAGIRPTDGNWLAVELDGSVFHYMPSVWERAEPAPIEIPVFLSQ